MLVLSLIIPIFGLSQGFKLGTPQVFNYEKEDFRSAAQNWDACYYGGHIFFANDGGLLFFNGIKWHVIRTPKNTILRSLRVAEDERIFASSQNELGYFTKADNGTLYYVDIVDSLSTEFKDFSEIWDLETIGSTLYFSSDDQIVAYNNGESKSFGKKSFVTNVSNIEGRIWYHTIGHGVFVIEEGKETFLKGSEKLEGFTVVEFIKTKSDELLILTEKNGIYSYTEGELEVWKNNAQEFLKEKRINCALYHEEQGLVIGTYQGGVIKITDNGLTNLWLNKQNGLQNTRINCMTLAPNGVLWIGTNSGIDEVDITTSRERFFPDNELEGGVFDVDEWNGELYFSTSNGLYHIESKDYYNPLNTTNFELVEGTQGQAWGTDIIDGQLYCAHHEGILKINENHNTIRLSEETGAWKFVKLSTEIVALGTYHGVSLYRYNESNQLEFVRKIEGFNESSRIMVIDKFENLWVSHPYKKLYKINFQNDFAEESVKEYDSSSGFNIDERNYVFNINEYCYLTNESGIYKYNEKEDNFGLASNLNDLFGKGNHVRRLIQVEEDIWAITEDYTCKVMVNRSGLETSLTKDETFFLNVEENYIGGFENLYPMNDSLIILMSEKGAIEYELGNKDETSISVKMKTVSLPEINNAIVFGGFGDFTFTKLEAKANSLKLEYQNEYPNSNAKYEYSINHVESEMGWSGWSSSSLKEYSNLNHGKHTFEVKSKNNSGVVSEVEGLEITIEAPWHSTITAYIIYTFIFLSTIAALLLIPRKKYKQDTEKLRQAKLESDEQVEVMKREKLENEIKFKNQELASSTFNLLKRNQTLTTLKDRLMEVAKKIESPAEKKELKKVISILKKDLVQDEDWDNFSFHFDQVHQDFIKKLKDKYPKLTANDHKLCAYLKMNLSTKEIAPLLSISVRGVEIGRYRLRKKLELDRTMKLNDFFNNEFA